MVVTVHELEQNGSGPGTTVLRCTVNRRRPDGQWTSPPEQLNLRLIRVFCHAVRYGNHD